ncbi:RND efflux system, outer membrane lipoprotein CmeC [Candidatus Burkholderia humilis]|nr:RND efflux system, outer membrane lipoprotein CmeC [Candidatus Burkholderia humilis]
MALDAAQQHALASLHQQANDSEALVATLPGVPSPGFGITTRSLGALRAPSIDAGVPSSLMTRRPDIAYQEAQFAAAYADVVAARAAMFPSITLTASVGTGSDRVQRIFDNPLYTVAAGLIAPIFDASALAAGRDLAKAQEEALLAAYRQSIIAAFADVDRALNASAGANAQTLAQDDELCETRRTLALAQSRYRAGVETALTVLDAQRTLYTGEDERVQVASRAIAGGGVDVSRAGRRLACVAVSARVGRCIDNPTTNANSLHLISNCPIISVLHHAIFRPNMSTVSSQEDAQLRHAADAHDDAKRIVMHALLNRQSHWPLVEPAPNDDELALIVDAALRAPDHGRLRLWRFVVVRVARAG